MSIYKRKHIYWYEFMWRGQRVRRSTKQSNRREAQTLEAAYRTALAKGEVGIEDRPVSKEPALTLKRFADETFLPHVRTKHLAKPKTLEYYENGTNQLCSFRQLADKSMVSLTGENIDQYILHRRSLGRQISTVNRELQVLRRMFKLAEELKKVDSPLSTVKLVAGENQRDRVLTREDELSYLMAARPLLRDVATIILDCGLRPEECFRLRQENIRDGAIYNSFGKTKAARRRIPTTERVHDILERRKTESNSEWVFPAPTRSGHIESSSVKKQHKRVFRLTKIDHFVLYSLRHTCITRWAPHMDAYTLGYLAGHSDMKTTQRYVHPSDDTVKAAFERAQKLPTLPETPHKTPHTTEKSGSASKK